MNTDLLAPTELEIYNHLIFLFSVYHFMFPQDIHTGSILLLDVNVKIAFLSRRLHKVIYIIWPHGSGFIKKNRQEPDY